MLRAEVRRAAEHDGLLNRPAAARAALAFLAILDEIASRMIGVALVPADHVAQDAAHRREDRAALGVVEEFDGASRMNGGLVQDLVDVEIAEAGEAVLRHEERLDRAPATLD